MFVNRVRLGRRRSQITSRRSGIKWKSVSIWARNRFIEFRLDNMDKFRRYKLSKCGFCECENEYDGFNGGWPSENI